MDLKRSTHGYSIESLTVKKTGSFTVNEPKKPGRFRRLLSQFVAATSINMILFDIGLALSYPTLVVPQLMSANETSHHDYNSTDVGGNFTIDDISTSSMSKADDSVDPFYQLSIFRNYSFTEHQTTWYVSILYICQPIGSIIGGSVVGFMGRKRLMQVLNLFMVVGWLLPFFSTGPAYMYISNIVFGIGIGCSEAPIATYLGEVSQVSIRGFILTLGQVFLSVSFVIPYLVELIVPSWRWQALILSVLPVVTFIMCTIVPETPIWLISKGRYKDAETSLKWLRGWTSYENIKEELDEITAYHLESSKPSIRLSNSAINHKSTDNLTSNEESLKDKIMYFTTPRMRRPFIIVCVMFALIYITGMCTIRPYLVPLFKEMDIKMNPDTCALWVTFAGIVGNVCSLCLIKFTGKRLIVLSGLAGSAITTLMVALIKMDVISTSLSFVAFLGISFFSGFGILPIPWMLQSELYPFRGRGVASGCGAAFSYIIGFITTKIYIQLTKLITLQGVFIVFTCFSIFGAIYLWFRLPETEGKTFEEIDKHFKEK